MYHEILFMKKYQDMLVLLLAARIMQGRLQCLCTSSFVNVLQVIQGEFKMPNHLSPEAKDLIQSLLVKNPEDRLKLNGMYGCSGVWEGGGERVGWGVGDGRGLGEEEEEGEASLNHHDPLSELSCSNTSVIQYLWCYSLWLKDMGVMYNCLSLAAAPLQESTDLTYKTHYFSPFCASSDLYVIFSNSLICFQKFLIIPLWNIIHISSTWLISPWIVVTIPCHPAIHTVARPLHQIAYHASNLRCLCLHRALLINLITCLHLHRALLTSLITCLRLHRAFLTSLLTCLRLHRALLTSLITCLRLHRAFLTSLLTCLRLHRAFLTSLLTWHRAVLSSHLTSQAGSTRSSDLHQRQRRHDPKVQGIEHICSTSNR